MEITNLIAALSRNDAYPFSVDEVEVHQTHISAVFLAGPYAYKIKKPVQLGFLDFSTLAKRKHFCEEEIRLNRRLAPEVYLGVVRVVKDRSHIRVEGDGELVEWAVKMQRLPAEATLEQLLLRGAVEPELITSLAQKVAAFHRSARCGEHIAEFGGFETVARNARENFEQVADQVGTTISREVWERLEELSRSTLQKLRPLIEKRAAEGVPRDTHGDLHLDHVYLFPGQKPPNDVVIVDCIEFNERFRFADPVADMAFLVMDLVFHHRRDLAQLFAEAYFSSSGDKEGQALLPFYVSYRAAVRGKVEGIELAETEVPPEERTLALKKARAHWLLALGELESPVKKPCLLLVAGLPGAGKSTLAKNLALEADFSMIRSDEIRKQLAGLDPLQLAPSKYYSAEWNERTYNECLRQAEDLLFKGKRVLVDASFWEEQKRERFLQAAADWQVPGFLFICQADEELIRARLHDRRDDPSDADWCVYEHVAEKWEAVGKETLPYTCRIPTNQTPQDAVHQALKELRKRCLYS